MKVWTVALVLMGLCSNAQAAERDWTIEQPLVAGFMTGVSLGVCWGCWHGSQAVQASEFDPFGVNPLVQELLLELGRRPFWIGVLIGIGLNFLLVGGVFYRRLRRLSARAIRNALETGPLQVRVY